MCSDLSRVFIYSLSHILPHIQHWDTEHHFDYADNFLIFAAINPELAHRGITAFIVERSSPSVTTNPFEGKLRIHSEDTSEIILENLCVPVANRLGEKGEGTYS